LRPKLRLTQTADLARLASQPRTGKRALALGRILIEAGLAPTKGQLPRPSGTAHSDELLELYRDLGGLLDDPAWKPGGWDLIFEGPLVVELDEQLHFNRYRARTLETTWTVGLPWADAYQTYCAGHEARCLRDGCGQQRWSNPSCVRNFAGGPPGDLDAGAPRWKQRAFYDAMKDTAIAAGLELSMARVSIYDTVDGELVDDILEGRAVVEPAAILQIVEQRTAAA